MKRLNVKLAVWLVVITLVSVVGVHFLHGYQLGRNAEFLLRQAEKARDEGQVKEAIKQYNQYLKYRDDREGYSALAALVVSTSKEADATWRDKLQTFTILQEAIRRHPDLNDVRRSLIDYTISLRRFNDALEHIEYLNGQGAGDAALDFKAADCYFQSGEQENALKKLREVVGYNLQTDRFNAEPGPGATQVKAFELMAQILRRKNDPKRADEAMAKMVEWNPDSAPAHLARAQYMATAALQSADGTLAERKAYFESAFAEARAELNKAYELAPNDVDVLLAVSAFAMGDRKFDEAQEVLDRALKSAPTRADVYMRLAQLANVQQNMKLAAEHLENGVKHATDVTQLLPTLAEVQITMRPPALDAARATCKAMYEREVFRTEAIRFLEARITLAEGNYWQAARELEAVRPAIARSSGEGATVQLDLSLGRCYEALSQPDRQLETFRRVLKTSPADLNARVGEAAALHALGRYDEATTDIELLSGNVEQFPLLRGILIQLMIADRMHRPVEKRDWAEIDKLVGPILEDPNRSELDKTLLKVDLELVKDHPEEAQKLLLAVSRSDPKDPRVWLGLVRVLLRKNEGSKVARLLDRAEQEAGDVVPLRAERARMIARERGENAGAELSKLEKGLDKFSQAERLSLMTQLGGAYVQVGSYDDGKRCWQYVVDNDPNNANVRQLLFELGVDHKDTDLMRKVVKDFHDSKNWGPQSTQYQYCAATELLWPINLRASQVAGALTLSAKDHEDIAEARRLIDEAIDARGEWSVLWRVRAEISQLEGNITGAIAAYKQALEYTRSGQTVIARRLVQLLYRSNRFAEADGVLGLVGDVQSSDPIYKVVQRIKEEQGGSEEALEMARKEVKADPKNAGNLIWYGQMLERASRLDEAEAAYRQATKTNPELAQAWAMLVRVLVINRKMDQAADAVRAASTPLEKNKLAMARLYELVGDLPESDRNFKAASQENPDDLGVARQIVEFYFRTAQADTGPTPGVAKPPTPNELRARYIARIKEAGPYLEQIIKKASQSNSDVDINSVAWARRCQAEIVAAPGDYEHAMRAAKLIALNAKNGKLGPDDARATINLLANRRDQQSRMESMRLLELLQAQRPLTPPEQFSLGQLYERVGNWVKGKDLIVSSLATQGNDPPALTKFISLLMYHDETDDAARWLDKLDDVLAKAPRQVSDRYKATAGELRARLLHKTGQDDQVVTVLENVIPRPLAPSQLSRLEEVAIILEDLKQFDAAERLLNEFMAQDRRGTIAMAAYVGRRGDLDKAFKLYDEARKSQSIVDVMPSALDALRRHPDKATPQRFGMLEKWATEAFQAEADKPHIKPQIKLLLAELYDLQGKYDSVIAIYRELLKSPDSTPDQLAITKNNLAFILALTKDQSNAAEALKLTEEAMQVMGPVSDLLDTRALAFLAQGKAEQAVTDLRSASADNPPSATKLVHLAQAEKQANNLEGARNALTQAQQIGVDINRFSPAEKKNYLELVDALK
jgi:cellulose synthase operon protein C